LASLALFNVAEVAIDLPRKIEALSDPVLNKVDQTSEPRRTPSAPPAQSRTVRGSDWYGQDGHSA
jgi:hypothetical protein